MKAERWHSFNTEDGRKKNFKPVSYFLKREKESIIELYEHFAENPSEESVQDIALTFDIETLDIQPTAVVLSLGITMFNTTRVQTFEELLDQSMDIYFSQEQQCQKDRTISESTQQWWEQQVAADPSHAKVLDNPNQINCRDLFVALNQFYIKQGFQPNRKETRWFSRGYFDIEIMNNFCNTFELDPIMKFWVWRDVRSYLDGAGLGSKNEKMEKPAGMVEHNAMHDSAFEAYQLQRILNPDN